MKQLRNILKFLESFVTAIGRARDTATALDTLGYGPATAAARADVLARFLAQPEEKARPMNGHGGYPKAVAAVVAQH
ncbi:MAG: hypothetical protein GC186_15410 [Rhodobacteraceae bacterium]|nr:hypothetical protein [Paracoccaceae bacterium]